jgi:hypothetical protein
MSKMTRLFRFAICLGLVLGLAAAPTDVHAAKDNCGQPVSNGDNPTASDCLFILNAAVAVTTCTHLCTCDLNTSDSVTATDALACLNAAVGVPDLLNCATPCPPDSGPGIACSSARLIALAGSDLDAGWNGAGHNGAIVEGAEISLAIVKKCSTSGDVCEAHADCPASETCDLTCNCDSTDPAEATCEITGPTGTKRCLIDMNVTCETSDDCPGGQSCESFFGPALPLSAEGTPTCITSYFQEPITGTSNAITGEADATAVLRSRVHLGISLETPCPRCGVLSPSLALGDSETCEGGPNDGAPCIVEAISPDFGGVSTTCPPAATANISGVGLLINFTSVSTGTQSKTAELACGGTLADFQGFCLDDFAVCTDNNDCLRCVDDPTVPCSSNGDCGQGECGAAPAQPVACGAFCHCGFCDGDPDQPCFSDTECSAPDVCEQNPVGAAEQLQPNNCTDLLCGLGGEELCCSSDQAGCSNPTPKIGSCSIKPFVGCGSDQDCKGQSAGVCEFENRPCFEHTITRTGAPSPLGMYCIEDAENFTECTTNADCANGACVADTARPITASLFCIPPTASPSINAAGGIPGPGAIQFNSAIVVCRCGDGEIGCEEECDDGNLDAGDGCDDACRNEP